MYSKTVAALCAAFTLSAVTTVNAQAQRGDRYYSPTKSLLSSPEITQTTGSDGSLAGPSATCVKIITPAISGTSGNARGPSTRYASSRSVYLVTAAEMAAAGYTSGGSPTSVGWNYSTAPGVSGAAPLKIYLQNTTDTAYSKGLSFAAAIVGMTTVHDASTTLPSVVGPFDITLSGGSPFVYSGGGLYVAHEWGPYAGTLSTTAAFQCNAGTAGSLAGANNGLDVLALSAFRPETRMNGVVLTDDVAPTYIYSLGELRFCGVPAQVIRATITNNGSDAKTNVPVTLTISGVDAFTDTQNVASLTGCGGQAIVTFLAYSPTNAGNNTVTISVPSDSVNSNNSLSRPMNNTPLDTSYKYPGSAPSGGVGFTGGQGAFVGKFTTTGGDTITAVKLEFFAVTAPTAQIYRVAIYADSGSGTPAIGAPLFLSATDITVTAAGPVTFTLPTPLAVPAGNFYVGLHQINTSNANFSFDNENPVRAGAFFFSAFVPPANPTAWTDFAPGTNFKLNIGYIGSNCEVLGACCTEGGGCTPDISESACSGIEGTWNEGAACDVCTPPPACPADTNNDGLVNVTDLLAVISAWGPCVSCPTPCAADVAPATPDCLINVTDLLAVISAWGACP